TNATMRLLLTTLIGIIVGCFIGASFQSLSLTSKAAQPTINSYCFSLRVQFSSNIWDFSYFEEKYSASGMSSAQAALLNVWSSLRGRRAVSKKF
ncbi:hypothetical protein M569_06706, partial [Genlisea aurea]